MAPKSRTRIFNYAIAVFCVAAAVGLRLALDPLLGDKFPFATLFLAVMVVSRLAGFRPALFALLLGALLGAHFLLPPRNSFTVDGFDNRAGLILYLILGFALALLGESMRAIQRRLENALRRASDQRGELERAMEERTQASTALRDSEARKAAILKASLDPIITFDGTGQIVAFNPAACALFGYSEADALGRNVYDLIASDTRDAAIGSAQKTALRRRFEAPAKRMDGTRLTVEMAITPLEGDRRHFTAFLRDITERKKSERIAAFLASASASLSTLVDYESTLQKVAALAVPSFADWCAVDVLETDGVLRRVAVCHTDPAKVELARDLHRRFPGNPATDEGAWKVLRTGQPTIVAEITEAMLTTGVPEPERLAILLKLGLKSYIGVPLKVRGKTVGTITFVAAESTPRYDAANLAAAEDLAQRAGTAMENAQLYRELRQADRRKDEFLATLAHELRNPLAPIRNALMVLGHADTNRVAAERARAIIERQVVQMVRLVDDLLDVNRITRNKLELRKGRVELAAVIQAAVETSRPLLDQGKHHLDVKLPEETIHLDADITRLAQVFSNLLNNSAKYTDPGGEIYLGATVEGGNVVVRVRDNGIGIPKAALAGLFEMFSQVDHHLERSQGGLGIGLRLVQSLVEMHGGTVEARSAGLGTGSEFIVRLPLGKPELGSGKVEAGNHPPADLGARTSPKRRILVVDDNKDSANSLSLLLSLMGNETRTAHDGLEALGIATEFKPELILLDIGMPKLNGYDTCRRLRDEIWGKSAVIVALTGWGQEEDRRRSAEAGFDHHMVKPVDPEALSKLLASPK